MREDARILLVEELDALGAAPADARARLAVLRAAGTNAALAILEPADAPWRHTGPSTDASRSEDALFTNDPAGRAALGRWLKTRREPSVLWASARGADAGQGLRLDAEVRWWPTGLEYAPGSVPSMLRHVPAQGAHDPFLWNPVEFTRLQRARLSLWDGPYVLAPMALQGKAGETALDAFARATAGREGFDLVVLAHAQPAFETLAKRLGIGIRVHFVGPAPREAELAWLQNAAAAVYAGTDTLSCGLPLRTLACGCPLLIADGAAPGLAAWCRRQGSEWSLARATDTLAERLEQSMDGAPEAKMQRSRGPELARAHAPEAVSHRLTQVLSKFDHAPARRAA